MEKKKIIVIVIVIILLLTSSFWVWQKYFKAEAGEIQASGTIEATSVELNAKLAGTINILTKDNGEQVKKSELVAELSRNDLVAQRERDELSVLKAMTNLADLQSGARFQEIKEAEANLNIARTNFKRLVDDFRRLEILFETGAVTELEYEKAQAAVEISKNQLEASEARFALLIEGSREAIINGAQVEVERNKAILKATEAMLEDLKIYSPIDGILSKNYELGEYVTPGASLATVINMDDLWIKVYLPTDDLPRVALGQKVFFTVSGFPKKFEGIVEEIANRGEFTPKTIQTKQERTNVVFAVKIRIENEGGILKPGLPADVVFPGGGLDD